LLSRSWFRIARLVTFIEGVSATHELRHLVAATRAIGVTAVSHHSAAHLHGLLDDEPTLIHVIAVRGHHPQPPHGVIVHHTRRLDVGECGWIDPYPDVPVTRPAPTIVMLAAYLGPRDLDLVVARALERACSETDLREAAARRQARGRRGPRRVVDALDRVLEAAPRERAEALSR
jgi:predicted transcriptional regulator of viral defense system